MAQPMPEDQAAPSSKEQGEGGADPRQLVMQIDDGLQQVTQMLQSVDPQLSEAMSEVNEQFRAIIEASLAGGDGSKAAPQEVPANAGAAEVRQAY